MSDEKKTDASVDPAGLVEKAFLLGIGILEMSKEKSQDFASELMESGKMSPATPRRSPTGSARSPASSKKTLRKTVSTETSKVAQDERACDQGRGSGPQVADRGAQGDARRFRDQG